MIADAIYYRRVSGVTIARQGVRCHNSKAYTSGIYFKKLVTYQILVSAWR